MEDDILFIPGEEMIPEFVLSTLSETMDWGLNLVGIPAAHKHTKGEGVKVAVLDTGYAPHSDLAEGIAEVIDCTGTASGGVDNQGHGIHVAGIIGARQNGVGVVGVAPEATIMPIKVLDDGGHGGFHMIERGIRAAMDMGADVINLSLGAPFTPPTSLHNAIKEAAARGIIIVAAAGNDSGAVNYPARYDEVIAVAALDRQGNLASFSSRGAEVDTGAPGVDIYSTYLNGQYALLKGTSQAAPFISGVCALILSWARANNLTISGYTEMLQRLDDLSDAHGLIGQWGDRTHGYGVPNFANAGNFRWGQAS